MIAELLPPTAVAVEAREDTEVADLHPEEAAIVGRAVEKRRREFATGRQCAKQALRGIGLPAAPIGSGERGQPLWPAAVVGSITHCDGYRAAAVARETELLSIGIDAEPNAPLPDGLLENIARPEERPRLSALTTKNPTVHWDRLLFSAKESVYKAWFPLAEAWLGFEDASLELDAAAGTFSARLLVPGPTVGGRAIAGFEGRWLARDGLLLTAIAVPA